MRLGERITDLWLDATLPALKGAYYRIRFEFPLVIDRMRWWVICAIRRAGPYSPQKLAGVLVVALVLSSSWLLFAPRSRAVVAMAPSASVPARLPVVAAPPAKAHAEVTPPERRAMSPSVRALFSGRRTKH